MTWGVQAPPLLRLPWPRCEWTEHVHNFLFFINQSADHVRAEPKILIRTDHGSIMICCTTTSNTSQTFGPSIIIEIHRYCLADYCQITVHNKMDMGQFLVNPPSYETLCLLSQGNQVCSYLQIPLENLDEKAFWNGYIDHTFYYYVVWNNHVT